MTSAAQRRIARHSPGCHCQRGVAVVMALLLTTLSVTLVAGLFWQQNLQMRLIENQRLQSHMRGLLRGTVDWARALLRDDVASSNIDHLGEAWASPLRAGSLYGFPDRDESPGQADGEVSAGIVDAQSRYNLRNLAPNGVVDPSEVVMLQRLLTSLGIPSRLAPRIAEFVALAYVAEPGVGQAPRTTGVIAQRSIGIERLEDLILVQGMNPELIARARNHLVLLPIPTPVNVNTASAEVMAARLADLSGDEVAALVAGRSRAYIRDLADLALRTHGKIGGSLERQVSVGSNYFLIEGKVRAGRSAREVHALLERSFMTGSRLVWIYEL